MARGALLVGPSAVLVEAAEVLGDLVEDAVDEGAAVLAPVALRELDGLVEDDRPVRPDLLRSFRLALDGEVGEGIEKGTIKQALGKWPRDSFVANSSAMA